MGSNLILKILDKATGAVPATKYAVGILAPIMIIAMIKLFQIDFEVAFWGTIIVLGLMIILVIFTRLTEVASVEYKSPIKLLIWSFTILFICICILLLSATFTGYPKIHSIFDRSTSPGKNSFKENISHDTKLDNSPGSTIINGNGNSIGR